MPVQPAGWAWPTHARKAHYFEHGSLRSLCGGWYKVVRDAAMMVQLPVPGDCCRTCANRLSKIEARAATR